MSDQTPIWVGALAGAVAGGLLGFLYFTPEGRRVRENLEPRLGEFMVELQHARQAADRARSAASEGWDTVRQLDATLRGRTSTSGRGPSNGPGRGNPMGEHG